MVTVLSLEQVAGHLVDAASCDRSTGTSRWQRSKPSGQRPWDREMVGDASIGLRGGILSAIDCVVKLEKKGERGVLIIAATFLHYEEH
jgi:hypothetical protein